MTLSKFFKIIKYLTALLFILIIFDLFSYNKYYVNKDKISFDLNNARNPQIKKILRFIDNYFGYFYFKISKKKQDEFFNIDTQNYNNLPTEVYIKAERENLTISNNKSTNNGKEWARSHGNHLSNKFSSLKKINKNNVKNLDVIWKHKFLKKGAVPGNPIFFEDKIILATPDKSLIALSVIDGKKIWEYKTDGAAAIRGLMVNPRNKKIYFCDQINLIVLNSKDGSPDINFGKNGKIKLKNKCQTTPIIIENKVIIATFEPGIEVYNLKNGKTEWKYYLKEKQKKYFRYGGKRFDYDGGNPWGGISADLERKILFISTGNSARFYDGINRPGNNKFSNSVIALDINKKKILWDFQEVPHDIWNQDIASPPILTTITIKDKKIDVVTVPTKSGNVLVLDRITGKSIFDYKNIKVPLSKTPGEKTSFYQKKFILPESISNQTFQLNHVSNLLPGSKEFILDKIKNTKYGFFLPNSTKYKNIIYKGGAQWMGASVDNTSGTMFVNTSSIPSFTWIEKIKSINSYYRYNSKWKVLRDQQGYPGSKPPWGNLISINLNTGKTNWKIPFGEYESLSNQGIPTTGTINFGGVTATAGGLVFATGTLDNKLRAFDSDNGKELWNYKMKFLGSSPPTIFEYENKQYIVVVSTGSSTINAQFPDQTELGNLVYAFKLRD